MSHSIAAARALKGRLLATAGERGPDIRPKHGVFSQAIPLWVTTCTLWRA